MRKIFYLLAALYVSLSLPCVSVAQNPNPALDIYGGWPQISCTNTGYFHTEKVQNRWWICDPLGHVFWTVGVYNVSAVQNEQTDNQGSSYYKRVIAKYGNADVTWGPQENRRLLSWGFNTLGEFSEKWVFPETTYSGWPNSTQPVQIPDVRLVQPAVYAMNSTGNVGVAMKDMLYGTDSNYKGWRGSGLPDFFDPYYETWMSTALKNYAFNSYSLGLTVDETDQLWGFGAGPSYATTPPGHNSDNPAWIVLATAPIQSYNPAPDSVASPQLYTNSEVVSKWNLEQFLVAKYKGSIAALNASWGSNYTTFESSGNYIYFQKVGTGNGTTNTFTFNAANPASPTNWIDPYSVQIFLNGQLVAGDCPYWVWACHAASGTGSVYSVPKGSVTGTVTYSSGTATVTFSTPPAAGASITANYVMNGWGVGTGLLDEDGRHTWMGTPTNATQNDPSLCLVSTQVCHATANPNMAADLNAWLFNFATQYFSVAANTVHSINHLLYFSTTLGTYQAPARAVILQAAAPYVDVLHETWDGSQAQLDFVADNAGDKPLETWEGSAANLDSCLWRYNPNSLEPTQEVRGSDYSSRVSLLWNGQTSEGNYPFVGFRWWDFVDMWNEKTNWGLVSLDDNAYDGKQAIIAPGVDPWGYPTGGEELNYGDFIDSVTGANQIWFQPVSTP